MSQPVLVAPDVDKKVYWIDASLITDAGVDVESIRELPWCW